MFLKRYRISIQIKEEIEFVQSHQRVSYFYLKWGRIYESQRRDVTI